jgi:hypothetical protein
MSEDQGRRPVLRRRRLVDRRQAGDRALGRVMDLVCVNHWDRAIETHKRMHPEARHYCQDVASARPIECVPEGRLDLLMASPTCTYHSRARGGRPTSDQQRMDPWHVVTWLTELKVERLLVENVPEFVDWGPVDPRTGKPIKAKKGEYFREWIATLEAAGLPGRVEDPELRRLRRRHDAAAVLPDGAARARADPLARADAHPRAGHDLLAPLQRWRPARECIDWALKGRSIFGRKHRWRRAPSSGSMPARCGSAGRSRSWWCCAAHGGAVDRPADADGGGERDAYRAGDAGADPLRRARRGKLRAGARSPTSRCRRSSRLTGRADSRRRHRHRRAVHHRPAP